MGGEPGEERQSRETVYSGEEIVSKALERTREGLFSLGIGGESGIMARPGATVVALTREACRSRRRRPHPDLDDHTHTGAGEWSADTTEGLGSRSGSPMDCTPKRSAACNICAVESRSWSEDAGKRCGQGSCGDSRKTQAIATAAASAVLRDKTIRVLPAVMPTACIPAVALVHCRGFPTLNRPHRIALSRQEPGSFQARKPMGLRLFFHKPLPLQPRHRLASTLTY